MLSSIKDMASPSSLFSTYASITTSIMLFRSMVNELIPRPIRDYLLSFFHYLFKVHSQDLTLVIEENVGISRNQLYNASELYLCTKISPETNRLRVQQTEKEKVLTIQLDKGGKIRDSYEGIEVQWNFLCTTSDNEKRSPRDGESERRSFELRFHNKHKETVLNSYLPFILERGKALIDDRRVLKMYTLHNNYSYRDFKWDSINLEHPSTFETLAMEPDLKNAVIEDLNKFIRRKKFYKRVGRAWKRGYLLYGPPGTGKSSLVAAIANYLKFDVYDLQLSNIFRDSDLRKLLLATTNRSILVIEDIDCSLELSDRRSGSDDKKSQNTQDSIFNFGNASFRLTLSGLLNFIDGLWSSCGDERIIIFTTNHKERLDPALLRPGRMDMHIHMSYCAFQGFKTLAYNYLELSGYHTHFEEIEDLLKRVEVTPAQVAEELMKSDDANVALEGLLKVLKRRNLEANHHLMNESASNETQEEKSTEEVVKAC